MAWRLPCRNRLAAGAQRNKHMHKQLCERLVHQRRSSFDFEMKSDVEIVLGGPGLASQSSFFVSIGFTKL